MQKTSASQAAEIATLQRACEQKTSAVRELERSIQSNKAELERSATTSAAIQRQFDELSRTSDDAKRCFDDAE